MNAFGNKFRKRGDFPGGPVVKNLLANAGDTGSTPNPGRFRVPGSSTTQPIPYGTTTEPSLWSPKATVRE